MHANRVYNVFSCVYEHAGQNAPPNKPISPTTIPGRKHMIAVSMMMHTDEALVADHQQKQTHLPRHAYTWSSYTNAERLSSG